MKKILSFILLASLLGINTSVLAAEPLKGSVTETGEFQKMQDELFTGKIETLNKKEIINISVKILTFIFIIIPPHLKLFDYIFLS